MEASNGLLRIQVKTVANIDAHISDLGCKIYKTKARGKKKDTG
jgi:hypothetical protein